NRRVYRRGVDIVVDSDRDLDRRRRRVSLIVVCLWSRGRRVVCWLCVPDVRVRVLEQLVQRLRRLVKSSFLGTLPHARDQRRDERKDILHLRGLGVGFNLLLHCRRSSCGCSSRCRSGFGGGCRGWGSLGKQILHLGQRQRV